MRRESVGEVLLIYAFPSQVDVADIAYAAFMVPLLDFAEWQAVGHIEHGSNAFRAKQGLRLRLR